MDKIAIYSSFSRYVILNPLKAKGMVNQLGDWPWSSYPAMVEMYQHLNG